MLAWAGITLLVATLLVGARRLPAGCEHRWLAVGLSAWLLIYIYTKSVGLLSYSAGSFFVFAVVAALLSATAAWLGGRHLAVAGRLSQAGVTPIVAVESSWTGKLVFLSVALLALGLGAALLDGFLLAPQRSPDAFSYHIPTVNSWLAWGNTRIQENLDYRFANWPHAVHSIYGWLGLATGSNRYLGLGNLLMGAALWPFAVSFTLRQLAFSREVAAVSASLSICNVIWFSQANAVSTDLVLGSLLVLSVGLTVNFLRGPDLYRGFLLSASLTLMAATKVIGMVFSVLFLLVLMMVFLQRLRAGKIRLNTVLTGSVLFAGLVLLVGGLTFWRNLFVYGNPVYPEEVSFAGELFSRPEAGHLVDWYYSTTVPAAIQWVFTEPVRYFADRPMAWSALYSAVFIALPVLGLLGFFWSRTAAAPADELPERGSAPVGATMRTGAARALVLFALIGLAVVYRLVYVNPPAINRYLYFGIFMLLIVLAWVLANFPVRFRRYLLAGLLLLGSAQLVVVFEQASALLPDPVRALDQRANTARQVQNATELLGDEPVLIVKQGNVQLPYRLIANPLRKTWVMMSWGPNYTDTQMNVLSRAGYEEIYMNRKAAKHRNRQRQLARDLRVSTTYRAALVERHCIVHIVSEVGPLRSTFLPDQFAFAGRLASSHVYRRNGPCERPGPSASELP